MAWPIKAATENGTQVFILLDPDSYLTDPAYKVLNPRGSASLRNLLALNDAGEILWRAEFPEPTDYYYLLKSVDPLVAYSFSSYRCTIDPNSGKVIQFDFFK